MQELIRTIIEAAPNWWLGIAAIAAIRLCIALAEVEYSARRIFGPNGWYSSNLPSGEEVTGWAFSLLGKSLLFAAATLGFSIWFLVSLWNVVLDFGPEPLQQPIIWLGLVLAVLEVLPTYQASMRKIENPQVRKWARGVAAVLLVLAAAIYVNAPFGVLLYAAVVIAGNVLVAKHRQTLKQRLDAEAAEDQRRSNRTD